jgi:hypothetical protein
LLEEPEQKRNFTFCPWAQKEDEAVYFSTVILIAFAFSYGEG